MIRIIKKNFATDGFEPSFTHPKQVVLPLNYIARSKSLTFKLSYEVIVKEIRFQLF